MKKNKRKILFVIPSASINGALIVLMDLYNYIVEHNPEIEIETIAQWGEDNNQDMFFKDKLSKYGKITFIQELDETEKQTLQKRLEKEDIAAIFYNSIITADTQLLFKEKKCKRIFFVHEMERLMNIFNLKEHKKFYNEADNLFIACSDSVKDALVNVLELEPDDVKVVYSFIDPETIRSKQKKGFEIEQKKSDLQILNTDEFVIGFSGTFELRKSADLLLPLVVEIKKRIKSPKIFWVGASPFLGEPSTYDMVMHDFKTAGFEKDVHFIPKSLDHIKYFQRFSVFIMISREDPFPLVNLEMGALGIPVLCFEKTGGSSYYAGHGCGASVPFMDLAAMADKISEFHANPQLLENYKKTIPEIVDNNFSVKVQAPKLLNLVKNFIK